ncbi:MAG TPA: tetratricopeptide repeat protein [Candidatus Binatia bacterium]|nr:tetratricopeptide repeat protein [Candidatus Binatia bacterium]
MVAALLSLALPAFAQIPVELRFDGRPFEPTALPEFSCRHATLGWTRCRAEQTGPGTWLLDRLPPGAYQMLVSIDENRDNPRRFPGDYEVWKHFTVTESEPERLVVDVPRLIHLTRPGDNARPIEGMLTGCATEPAFDTPRYAWTPAATVAFAWEPIVDGAEYRYTVVARGCAPPRRSRDVLAARTGATAVALALPPPAEGESYAFRVEAWKDGRLVGDLYTHDAGTHSWEYRFRVVDASLPRWAYALAAGAAALLVLGAARLLGGLDPPRRRRRVRALAGGLTVVLVLGAGGTAAYYYVQARERQRAEAERAAAEAQRARRLREVVAAFASAAPRPAWWDDVQTPFTVDNVGDLLAAWQGHGRGEEGERQFFKAAYQGIVDHPDDEHVVATAIQLMYYVDADYPHRLGLARFGYERYFAHRRRVDNCANCMAGDTSAGLAEQLSRLYREAGRFDEAVAVCRRVIDERAADVSPYVLADVWNEMAWAYWRQGDRERAREVVREALARYGSTVRGEALQRTLVEFEKER